MVRLVKDMPRFITSSLSADTQRKAAGST